MQGYTGDVFILLLNVSENIKVIYSIIFPGKVVCACEHELI